MIDITDESYESDLSEEESNKLLLLCGHAVGPQLSPAAQAVRDAVLATYADNIPKDDNLWALERASTVAALRAAADQVVPEDYDPPTKKDDLFRGIAVGKTLRNQDVRAALYRIAAELEGQ